MNTTYLTIVVVILVFVGAIAGMVFARRKRSERLHEQLGPEYDRTVQAMGGAAAVGDDRIQRQT